ncbi:hypothetical protein KBY83_12615 [Cyanobium sp. WKJ7-Wakatipu]|uniref:hypothetical protein n=1 Tax=Cyanobium sp. WKJ7-Wakatipu TaxID=2823726 RepID=UPI0020CC4BCD|nr:hypothetical protein [Cyanobium sp. WKJ7-Wakatipu]MCP9784143.1 hypothetical protein [Cyanobium sp. WKJ7-Wakatipu]
MKDTKQGPEALQPSFYPIQKRWRRLRPLFEQRYILELMHEEMECYAEARAEDHGYEYRPRPFSLELRPADYDNMDWRWSGRRGPQPGYWAWAAAGACHWLASHNLFVIRDLEPDRPWQIATSDKHSTVVDLERKLLFDPNFMAMGIFPEECWKESVGWHNSEILPMGVYIDHTQAKHQLEAA